MFSDICSFDKKITDKNPSGSIETLLNNLQLSIPAESKITQNAIQDLKIKTYYFKTFNTSSIKCTIMSANGGTRNIRLKMNTISHNTPFTYSLENETIVLFAHLDLKKWNGEEAIAWLDKKKGSECL